MGVSQKGCKYRKNFYKILKILTHIFEENAHFELVPALLDGIDNQIESTLDLGDLAGTALDDGIDGRPLLGIEGKEEIAFQVGSLSNQTGFESTIAVKDTTFRIDIDMAESLHIGADSVYDLVRLPPDGHGVGNRIFFFLARRESGHKCKSDGQNAEEFSHLFNC